MIDFQQRLSDDRFSTWRSMVKFRQTNQSQSISKTNQLIDKIVVDDGLSTRNSLLIKFRQKKSLIIDFRQKENHHCLILILQFFGRTTFSAFRIHKKVTMIAFR